MPAFSGTCKLLGGTGLDGEVSLDLLAPYLRQKMALPPLEARVVERARVGALPALELVKVKLALKRCKLGVCVGQVVRRGRSGT